MLNKRNLKKDYSHAYCPKKEKENIAEYILYLFQIEDIVRSFKFDVDEIMEVFVLPNLPDRSFEGQYRKWYQEIITEMKAAKLDKKGHIDRIMEVFRELVFLHNTYIPCKRRANTKHFVKMLQGTFLNTALNQT